ncbi:MAG: DUF4198 domain-containing protein [Sedimentitalea sp.]
MIVRSLLPKLCLCLVTAFPALSHEFWIEPHKFQVEPGEDVIADLRNGQIFKGSALAFFDRRIERFDLVSDDRTVPVAGRMGDIPALATPVQDQGLLVLVHQTAPSTLKYNTWEKFQKFADHKDFPDIRTRHLARDLPLEGFTESYSRYAKALVGVGHAKGSDAPTGMETEFVALTNPYTDDLSDGFQAQLLYQGRPRGDAQVEVFERAPDDTVTVTLLRTDADGQVSVPVQPDHDYLIDAVILRPMPEGDASVWESLWAAFTFGVPD